MTTHTAQAGAATVSQRLARWVTDLRFEDLPEDVVDRAQMLILDQLGLQIRGATLPNVQPVRRLSELAPGPDQSTVTGAERRTSPAQAAWVNGTLGSACEFDDAHELAWHTSSAVVPAALALTERDGASGRDLLVAVVAGVQVMCLLGTVASQGMLRTGWHGSKVMGVFGAAAAAGKVLDLDAEQLAHAFGIAASDAGGTMEYDRSGGEVKRLHAGVASRSGTEAALLAQAGLTGPAAILEGDRGIFAMFAGTADTAPLERGWDRWHILDTVFRFYPTVGTIHAPLDLVKQLRAEHGIEDWRTVTTIRVGLADVVVGHGAHITRPTDAISAQFSLAFSTALQLVTGRNAPQDYMDPRRWNDPEILAAADLVQPYAIAIPAGDSFLSSRVEITLHDGRSFERYQAGFTGHPARPATRADVTAKFRDNTGGVISDARAQAVIDAVCGLAGTGQVRSLAALLAM